MIRAALLFSALVAIAAPGLVRSNNIPGEIQWPAAAAAVPDVDQITRGLWLGQNQQEWTNPKPNQERVRGPGGDIYAKVAPGVVVVRTSTGHGTGFVVREGGWIVTNHHVIENADADVNTGALQVFIHFGRLEDGAMRFEPRPHTALVYRTDAVSDLALIKLIDPKSAPSQPLRFAAKGPAAGSDCFAVGHPATGLLWSIRPGNVTAVGDFPHDRADLLLSLLGLDEKERGRLAAMAAAAPRRKAVFSNCLIFSGDSGGPVVDSDGEVIGVTFGVAARNNQSVQGFSYHIHREIADQFCKRLPLTAPIAVPNPWPPGTKFAPQDLDGDGTPETLTFGVETGAGMKTTGLLIDPEQLGPVPGAEVLADPKRRAEWKYRLAVHQLPRKRAFYDTNGSGRIDLILTDVDAGGLAHHRLVASGGVWKYEPIDAQPYINPNLLKVTDGGKARLEKIKNRLKS